MLAHLSEKQIAKLYGEIAYMMELPGSRPASDGLERIVCTHGAIVALCNATFGYIGRHKYCDMAKSWFVCGDDNIWSPTPGGSNTCLQLERAMEDDLRLARTWLLATPTTTSRKSNSTRAWSIKLKNTTTSVHLRRSRHQGAARD